MTHHETQLSFLSKFFEEFYYDVLHQKARVLSGRWLIHDQTGAACSPEEATESILKNFEKILNGQSLKAHQEGGAFGLACYREAQYLMAALADEIFLNLPWEGLPYWESHLLEERLFFSHISGEKFFQVLDNFLKERNPLKRELGILYLTCLGLGFQGKYRGFDDKGDLHRYRVQLFTLVYYQKPSLFQSKDPLFQQPLLYTLEGSATYSVEDNRKWLFGFLLALVGYVIISYGVWFSATYTLNRMTFSILSDVRKLR